LKEYSKKSWHICLWDLWIRCGNGEKSGVGFWESLKIAFGNIILMRTLKLSMSHFM